MSIQYRRERWTVNQISVSIFSKQFSYQFTNHIMIAAAPIMNQRRSNQSEYMLIMSIIFLQQDSTKGMCTIILLMPRSITTTTTTTILVSSPICVVSLAHTNRGREKLFYSWSKLSKNRHVKYLFEIQPNRNIYFFYYSK